MMAKIQVLPSCLTTFPRFSTRMRRYRKILALLFLILVVIYLNFKYNRRIEYYFLHNNLRGDCLLPELNINDEEIMKFYFHPDPIKCENIVSVIYIDDEGMIQFNTSALSSLKLSKEEISCTYSILERKGDDEVILKPEVKFTKPEYINGDFIVVRCKDKSSKYSYENLHVNINYKHVLESRQIRNESEEQMSIMLFGVDSLSRMHALRKLPLTMKYFEDELGGIVYKGYTKVGGNSFPNIAPLLTGKHANLKELPHLGRDRFFDDYPFIFYNYSKMGYTTMLAEDFPEFSTFNYLTKGFNKQPTDHYLRPLYLAMSNVKPVTTALDPVFLFLEDKNIKLTSSSLCFRNTPKHVLFLQYLKRYMHSYKNKLKFSFSWMSELSHEYMNFMELADQDFLDFFKWMKGEGHLDKTILIFLSDHGINSAEIRNTVSGRIETRLPLLAIALPEHFKLHNPKLVETMWSNTKVITTAFDVNIFLGDVLQDRFNQNVFRKKGKLPRGIGISREIPKERTCAEASIGESFCACYSSKTVNTTIETVQRIASGVVSKINLLLKNYKHKCAHLRLSQVKYASRVESYIQRIEEVELFTLRKYFTRPKQEMEKYTVLLETTPGAALFETMASMGDDGDIIVFGEIMRTNKYGTQSQCITDKYLRNFCFCT